MRLRHRRARPHSGAQRHLNPPFGANKRHGGRLHIRAEGAESSARHDRPKRRDSGGGTTAGGTNPGMSPAQLEMLQESQAMNPASSGSMPYNPTAGGSKRGGRVGIRKRAAGGEVDAAAQRAKALKGSAATEEDVDAAENRKSGGKADGHWMEKAFANSHGQFRAKAKRAGKSVAAEAAAVTKPGSHASTKTKRQANLAKLGAKYGGH